MEQQLSINFDPNVLARRADPETSREAAQRVREFGSGQCVQIMDLLLKYGPMSPEQLAAHMNIDAYSVRKRLSDLENHGMARPNGMTCSTVSGRRQRIWESAK